MHAWRPASASRYEAAGRRGGRDPGTCQVAQSHQACIHAGRSSRRGRLQAAKIKLARLPCKLSLRAYTCRSEVDDGTTYVWRIASLCGIWRDMRLTLDVIYVLIKESA